MLLLAFVLLETKILASTRFELLLGLDQHGLIQWFVPDAFDILMPCIVTFILFLKIKKFMSELELEWLVFCLCRDVNYALSVARLIRLPSEEMSAKC